MLSLPTRITHSEAHSALAALVQGLHVHTEPEVVVDAGALQVFDTSALAVLLECRRQVLSAHQTMRVRGLPPALESMAVLYGVDTLLFNFA